MIRTSVQVLVEIQCNENEQALLPGSIIIMIVSLILVPNVFGLGL